MEPTEQLIEAIKANDAAQVTALLDANPALAEAKTADGVSALMLAVYYGRSEIAQMLRSRRERLSLFEAAALGASEQVSALLDNEPAAIAATSPDGFSPLGLAAFFGHPEVVDLLLARGADVNVASRNAMRVMPLHSAVAAQNIPITEALLAAGADVNAVQADEFTPLHGAAQNGQIEMLRLLLAHGADASARMSSGKTGYDLAVEQGHSEAAEMLR